MPSNPSGVPVIGTLGKDRDAVREALKVSLDRYGCAALDCAPRYGNLDEIGSVLSRLSPGRDRVRITSKINASRQENPGVRNSVMSDLAALNRDCLDGYLIHSPRYRGFPETWRDIVTMQNEGLILDAGISNFGKEDCLRLPPPEPAIVQISAYQYFSEDAAAYGNGVRIEVYGLLSFHFDMPVEKRAGFSAACAAEGFSDDEGIMIAIAKDDIVPVLGTSKPERLIRQFGAYDYGLTQPALSKRLNEELRKLYA